MNYEQNKKESKAFTEMLECIDNFPKPTISLVNGHAFGGALGVIAASDYSFSYEKCNFCFSEVKLGLIPAMIAPYIVRSLGYKVAKRLFLTGEIFDAKKALTVGLIDEIISQLRPSTIASSGEYDPTFRTSSTCDLGYKNTSLINDIDKKICDFIGIDSSYGEILQGQHYRKGQEFKEHTDYFDAEQLVEHDKGRGQRTYTFMIYLNDVLEGGETEFPKLNKIFSPEAGKALIWNNLNEDSTLNGNTTHQAHPVQKGNKTIVTKWFREKIKN